MQRKKGRTAQKKKHRKRQMGVRAKERRLKRRADNRRRRKWTGLTIWRPSDQARMHEFFMKNKSFRFIKWECVKKWKDNGEQLDGIDHLTRVRRFQLKSLLPERDLCCAVMEAYFKLLQDRAQICWLPSVVYQKMVTLDGQFNFRKFIRKDRRQGINRIFFPVCYSLDTGVPATSSTTSNHWVLIMANLPERKLYVSDSLRKGFSLNYAVIRRSFGTTFDKVNRPFCSVELKTNVQASLHDCGVCVIMVVRAILLNQMHEFLNFEKINLEIARKNILRELVFQVIDFRWGASTIMRFAGSDGPLTRM